MQSLEGPAAAVSTDAGASASAFDIPDFVRRIRRAADLSQREIALRTAISKSTISRIEAGTHDPSVGLLQRLLEVVGWELAIADRDGNRVGPLREYEEDLRDGAGRRYPAHLDVTVDPRTGEWWGDQYGLARPPETFRRSRWARDRQRETSQITVGRGRHRRDR